VRENNWWRYIPRSAKSTCGPPKKVRSGTNVHKYPLREAAQRGRWGGLGGDDLCTILCEVARRHQAREKIHKRSAEEVKVECFGVESVAGSGRQKCTQSCRKKTAWFSLGSLLVSLQLSGKTHYQPGVSKEGGGKGKGEERLSTSSADRGWYLKS